jgi:hypothetical protein
MRARPDRLGFHFVLSARWPILAGIWLLAVAARSGGAQERTADQGRTTLSGVYTAAQADRGQSTFEGTCLGGCHNASFHRGTSFRTKWAGKPLWDLYDLILETMPDDDQGSLSDSQSAALVAYVLKYNGLPEGKADLPTDPEALKKIKIEFPAQEGRASARPERLTPAPPSMKF